MSWDIYGNKLERGFCEVHPHVREEYPCSLCYAENDKKHDQWRSVDMQREEYERAMKEEHYDQLAREYSFIYRVLCFLDDRVNFLKYILGKAKERQERRCRRKNEK